MSLKLEISSNLEDYLEAIYHLIEEKRVARARDIAERIGVQMSSVTGALKHLAAHDLVNYEPYQYVTLTPAGRQRARDILRRHEVLKDFFTDILALEAQVAEDNACRMEHTIGPAALERLVQFAEFLRSCPRGAARIKDFPEFCRGARTAGGK